MNTKSKALLVALVGGLGLAVTAHAHRMWILPAVTVLSGQDQWVSVEAAVSNNLFFPNHRPVSLASIDVRDPEGQPVELQNSVAGRIRSSFELQLKKEGTYVISLKPSMGGRGGGGGPGMGGPGAGGPPPVAPKAVAADDDDDDDDDQPAAPAPQGGGRGGRGGQQAGNLSGSWTENGQIKRWRGTEASLVSEGMAAKPGFKLQGAGGRKVVTYVTLGEPSTENIKPVGKDLEIDFVTHPNDLFAGEAATFRFVIDGKPAAGAKVTVVRGDDRFRNDVGETKLEAGADGVVKITWPEAGRYWLQASAAIVGEQHGVPLEKTSTFIGVFEVLPQ